MGETNKILIIEDDPRIVNLLEIHLSDLGFTIESAIDGQSGLDKALKNSYKMIVLDLMLPELDGIEVCRRIRQENRFMPILMLTARSEEFDKVLGLEIGADDYITKPFSIREFIARVKVILRRIEVEKEKNSDDKNQTLIEVGNLLIDTEQHKVILDGRPLELTAKEFDLLVLFARHPGKIYNRETLLELVWGYHYEGYEHTVNSHINRLRNKIESDPTKPKFIKTLWGVGYRFEIPEEITS
ncbi:response regulator transcription factor [Caldithrix abyssi]